MKKTIQWRLETTTIQAFKEAYPVSTGKHLEILILNHLKKLKENENENENETCGN